jgi:arginine decarboxylase
VLVNKHQLPQFFELIKHTRGGSNHMQSPPFESFSGFFELAEALERVARYDHSVSVPELGSLFAFDPDKLLSKDQQWLAEAYNVRFAWPYTNGTTALNVMALMTVTWPGDTVLCQRDSHISVFSPMIQLGLRPVYLTPPYSAQLGINLGVTPQQLRQALDQHPDTRAVFLTYPNYFGVATDIHACAQIVQERGIPLIVDSAHGAHFHFHPHLPLAAEETGATIVTQSTHKTCAALSQGSLALFNDEHVIDRFYEIVNQLGFLSTSFSYVILQSVMLAVLQLELQGETLLGQAIEISEWVRAAINRIDGLHSFGCEQPQLGFAAFDPLRVTVDVSQLGLTGFAVEDILIQDFNIYPEMATLRHVLFLFTLADDWAAGQRIVEALQDLARRPRLHQGVPDPHPPKVPPQVLLPRQVFFSQHRRCVPVKEAIGLVSAETIATYPPGSPIIVAGEEITSDAVEFLQIVHAHGGVLKGASDPHFATISVVDRPAITCSNLLAPTHDNEASQLLDGRQGFGHEYCN